MQELLFVLRHASLRSYGTLDVANRPIAFGEDITQMVATGDLPDIAAGRQLIRDSIPLKVFSPQDPTDWNKALARFEKLL